jgi:hypothetical protein
LPADPSAAERRALLHRLDGWTGGLATCWVAVEENSSG